MSIILSGGAQGGGGGGGGDGAITDPIGSQPSDDSVSVTPSQEFVVEAGTDPVYADDPAISVSLRDAVPTGYDSNTLPGSRLLPIGFKNAADNALRHPPMTTTPWNIDSFGQASILVREIGAAASQIVGANFNALNAAANIVCAANNINSLWFVVNNTSSFVGTIGVFQLGADNIERQTVAYRLLDGRQDTEIELNQPYVMYVAGTYNARVRVTSYDSGSATAFVVASNATPVVFGTVVANPKLSHTATTDSVDDDGTSQTLLAANPARLGATIYNDSSEVLYLKLGATASTTDYTVKMAPQAYYEVPTHYTGIIDGVWANDSSGAARITELS